jgi:hypothetical protein
MVPSNCISQNRCSSITCNRCARRYASRLARRVLATNPRHLFAVEFQIALPSIAAFRQWRTQVRNYIDHRRRADRWWNSFALTAWHSRDGCIRGAVMLDALTEEEVLRALNARWPTTLRCISATELFGAICDAVRPDVIARSEPSGGRYQSLKVFVTPRRKTKSASYASPLTRCFEPMPVLI